MLKKVIITVIVLGVIAAGIFMLVPWGEYESSLEKSEIQDEVIVDSTGVEVPSLSLITGVYTIESGENAQAELLFDVEGLKKTKGAFEKFTIDFEIAEDYTQSALTVTIQSATLNTGNTMRDEHLVEADFFDVVNFPTIKFKANHIAQTDTAFLANGDLTLLAETLPLDVPFKHLGKGTDKNGNDFEAFEGNFVFDRTAYGMEEVSGAGNIVTVSFYCELISTQEE